MVRYEDGALFWREGFGRRRVGARLGYPARNGYLLVGWQTSDGRRKLLIHRLVWLVFNDELPPILDHIDRDRTNNRIENLRPTTASGNQRNRDYSDVPRVYKGLPRGVTMQRGKYKAQIKLSGKTRYIALCATPEEAAAAYEAFVSTMGVA